MYKFLKLVFTAASIIIAVSCNTNKIIELNYTATDIEYWGRIDSSQVRAAEIFWSGSSIKLNFEGESISAMLKDQTGNNYFNVILDNDSIRILRPDTTKKLYELASNLAPGKHTIEIFKRTEWIRGTTEFYGFQIKGNAKVLVKSEAKKRKIEFYGNSITAGYAIEDYSGKDSPDSIYTNNFLSYAALTARHFDAKYSCICRSGIGVTVSWFPQIMPEMYNLLNSFNPHSKWDFSKFTPDIVVINLLQNDSWIVNLPEYPEFKARFGTKAPTEDFIINAYARFIALLRTQYPNAHIICALGTMDATKEGSKWPGYIEQAVNTLKDPKTYTYFMKYKGTSGHPNVQEQQEMANGLIKFIDKNIKW